MSKEIIVKLTSDHIKVKGGEYMQDLVRCGECKHGEYREEFDDYECRSSGCGLVYDADFFCADGERREP